MKCGSENEWLCQNDTAGKRDLCERPYDCDYTPLGRGSHNACLCVAVLVGNECGTVSSFGRGPRGFEPRDGHRETRVVSWCGWEGVARGKATGLGREMGTPTGVWEDTREGFGFDGRGLGALASRI